jgi:hypothetical protein
MASTTLQRTTLNGFHLNKPHIGNYSIIICQVLQSEKQIKVLQSGYGHLIIIHSSKHDGLTALTESVNNFSLLLLTFTIEALFDCK